MYAAKMIWSLRGKKRVLRCIGGKTQKQKNLFLLLKTHIGDRRKETRIWWSVKTQTIRTFSFFVWEIREERERNKNVKLMTIAILQIFPPVDALFKVQQHISDVLSSFTSFLTDFFPWNLKTFFFALMMIVNLLFSFAALKI